MVRYLRVDHHRPRPALPGPLDQSVVEKTAAADTALLAEPAPWGSGHLLLLLATTAAIRYAAMASEKVMK